MSLIKKAVKSCNELRDSFSCGRSVSSCYDSTKETMNTIDLSRKNKKIKK